MLFYCVASGHTDMFNKLLKLGVQIESDLDGMTLLMEAAYEGHMNMVQHLIERTKELRVNLHQVDSANRNALYYAFENSHLNVVKYLLSAGSRLEPTDHNKTVLMSACLKANMKVVKYCLENSDILGLNTQDQDDKGRNCLFYAVTGGNVEILQYLINSGAKVLSSPDGINLLMQAAGKKQLDIGRYAYVQTM